MNEVKPSEVTLSVTIVVPGCWMDKEKNIRTQESVTIYNTCVLIPNHGSGEMVGAYLTSSKTMAESKAMRRLRLNSRPVESTAADLYKIVCKRQSNKSSLSNRDSCSYYLSTSVSKMIPKSALLSRTALVIASIADLSSGLGIWFGNIPDIQKVRSSTV